MVHSSIYCFAAIHKELTKILKTNGCETLVDWIKPCQNHFYWSTTSTTNGDGSVLWAKFKSFLSHIINKHSDLDNTLFNKCAYDTTIAQRKLLMEGVIIFYHVQLNINHWSLLN